MENELRFVYLRDSLSDALDDLPRYFAVVGQSREGWLLEDEGPEMRCCVSVDDVREMLRRQLKDRPA